MSKDIKNMLLVGLIGLLFSVPAVLMTAGVISFGGAFQPFIIVALFLISFAGVFALPAPTDAPFQKESQEP
jgi:hypothetical protein